MTYDSAKSRRKDKQRLFATLDMAIIQSGVKDLTADKVYALSVWTMDQGRLLPWYARNEKSIVETEGGYDQIILGIAGIALSLAKDNPDDAFFLAGKQWRADIRRQWGDTYGGKQGDWHVPTVFTDLESEQYGDDEHHIEDWLTEYSIELAPPSEPFDPDDIKDPRLQRLWGRANTYQRHMIQLMADGVTNVPASELMGVKHGTYRNRKTKLRALATGPAA